MKMKDYTALEIAQILEVSSQRVQNLAKEQGWGTIPPQPKKFDGDDVSEYLFARWRRDLARQMGIKVKTLVRHDEWDMPTGCPVCGEFAIWKPASPDEIQNFELPVYSEGWSWICRKGHYHESN
jgi:hypothetical protein